MGADQMRGNIFLVLGVSLALTLIVECCYAVFWRVRRQDLLLIILANLLTNPVVVLCHRGAAALWPSGLAAVTLALELGAIGAEGHLYHTRSCLKHPWLFSMSANVVSYTIGCLL